MSEPIIRSNCFFFAVGRWLSRGGYLLIRKSRLGWWPHFLHGETDKGDEVAVCHLVPIEPLRARGLLRFFPIHVLIFRGRVKTNDRECGDLAVDNRTDERRGHF